MLQPIRDFFYKVDERKDRAYLEVGSFLDKHPTVFKSVMVGSHFFRAVSIYGMMMVVPLPAPINCGMILAGSFIYRSAIEQKFCSFRFALPACVGGVAIWVSKASLIGIISGKAFATLSLTLLCAAGMAPFFAYTAWVIHLSHQNVASRTKTEEDYCFCTKS